MENSNTTTQQVTVSQPQQQQFAIQQESGAAGSQIQIYAQDPNNHAGKAVYIIDPNQPGSGIQMISNSDQRFEYSAAPTVPTTNITGSTTVMMNGQQVIAQRLPVALESIDEPLYVNAKQYHRIIKRRQARAKLEAEGKIPKTRRKYLHESRHLHAVRRNRSMGGRFVGKQGIKSDENDTVSPRTTSNDTTDSENTSSAPNTSLQHTLMQIQNNMPVMSTTIQPSVSTNASSFLDVAQRI